MTSCSCPTLHILCINYLSLSPTTLSRLQLPWACGLSCSCDILPGEHKLVNIPARRNPVVLLCCGVNWLVVKLSSSQMCVSSTFLGGVSFLRIFLFPFLFPWKNKCCFDLLGRGRWRISQFLGTSVSKKSFHYSGTSPMRPNELWICPDTEPPGLAPGCQRL